MCARDTLAPATRDVYPLAVTRVDGQATNAESALAADGHAATLLRADDNDPAIVLDFGQLVSGTLSVDILASSGVELRVAVSESLAFLGRDSDVNWGEQHTYAWPLAPNAQRVTTGQVTLRYAMLFLGAGGHADIDDAQLHFTPLLGTPDTYSGCFETSDDLLNRIWHAGAYTLELSTIPAPDGGDELVDGAKHDRQLWAADLATEAQVEYVTHGRADLVRDALANLARQQRTDGSIPPSPFDNYTLRLDDYSAWWVHTLAGYVLHTGDDAFARQYYVNLQRQIGWFQQRLDANGLLVKDGGLEWAYTLNRTGEVTYLNVVWQLALSDAAWLARQLGRTDDAADWQAHADALRDAINARLFDAARGVYVDSDVDRAHVPQDANVLALLSGVAPPEARAGILDYLRANMWTDFGSTTVDSPYGTGSWHDKRIWPFMGGQELAARFTAGDAAGAYELLRREWGQMLDSDPGGTFWEWLTADGQPETGFDSLAHGWSAGPTATLTEHVLGVAPTAPGYARFNFAPQPNDLSWARGRVPTPHGAIEASWRRDATEFAATLVVPDGTTADVTLPQLPVGALTLVDGQPATAPLRLGPGTHDLLVTATWTYFPETAQYLAGAFKTFWDVSGGLPVFGYPLDSEHVENNADTGVSYPTQSFERQRFEYHVENAGTPYEVLLGRLGAQDAARRGLLGSAPFQALPADHAGGACAWFVETGHSVCGRFLDYWRGHGLEFGEDGVSYREALALFGFPLSEPFNDPETGLTVQYFERARFEWHPEHAGTPYEVLLGRLGAE
jgi:hypothetical protein